VKDTLKYRVAGAKAATTVLEWAFKLVNQNTGTGVPTGMVESQSRASAVAKRTPRSARLTARNLNILLGFVLVRFVVETVGKRERRHQLSIQGGYHLIA
jgi:hypothetical protein